MKQKLPHLLLFLAPFITASLEAQDFSALDAAAGLALFERNWVAAPASTTSADGLGPYYNARSCAACHQDGGGGSEARQLNLVIDDPVYGRLLQTRAVAGLRAEAVATFTETEVDSIQFADGATVVLSKPAVAIGGLQHGELQSGVSVRRAPGLAGLALLEQIAPRQLEALADPEDSNADGISGRLSLVTDASGAQFSGRFGWKATGISLRQQMEKALSLDLGLSTAQFPDAAGDCTAMQSACLQAAGFATGRDDPDTGRDEPEVSALMSQLMMTYLGSLAPPRPSMNAAPAALELFTTLGCAGCHVARTVGANDHQPWSDLLLHDMGPGLADDFPNDPESDLSPGSAAAEWRTAPLWGLGRHTRYLHDARASSLEQAILWHGGEAERSREAYRKLSAPQRQLLHGWLLGL